MHRFFTPLLRVLYGLLAIVLIGHHSMPRLLASRWNCERLYRVLETGEPAARKHAAIALAHVGGEEQLLRALQAPNQDLRQLAAGALFELWLGSAGAAARADLFDAFQSIQKKHHHHALAILTQVIQMHPQFAEAWSRRAALRINLGQFDLALEDAQRAAILNPANFAAWQEMAICYMKFGRYDAAIRSWRTSLRLMPFDPNARQMLRHCLELRREPARPLPPSRWRQIV